MRHCLISQYVAGLLFLLLGLYLHEIIQQEHGTRQKSYLFFLDCLFRRKSSQMNSAKSSINPQNMDETKLIIGSSSGGNEQDEDCVRERSCIYGMQSKETLKFPLICQDLKKVYQIPGASGQQSSQVTAVQRLNLSVKPGEIFGLLGPNGAGKTTLISMITGMISPTSGNAWIMGHDIQNQIELVHLNIGVCPQFDLLWPDLTVEEHLQFYARIKGIQPAEESQKVQMALEEVALDQKDSQKKVKELSGGMKRRLSIAIALVGDPKIIFLDEPSTGLDPDNRQKLWKVLEKCRGKRAIFLTTHSVTTRVLARFSHSRPSLTPLSHSRPLTRTPSLPCTYRKSCRWRRQTCCARKSVF